MNVFMKVSYNHRLEYDVFHGTEYPYWDQVLLNNV